MVEGKSSLCTFQIHGNKFKGKNKTGELFSPTYPGKKIGKKTFLIDKFFIKELTRRISNVATSLLATLDKESDWSFATLISFMEGHSKLYRIIAIFFHSV